MKKTPDLSLVVLRPLMMRCVKITLLALVCLSWTSCRLGGGLLNGKSSKDETIDGIEIYQGKEVAAGEVLIQFNDGAEDAVYDAAAEHNIEISENVGGLATFRLKSKTKHVDELMAALTARGDLDYVHPNYIIRSSAFPSAPTNPFYLDGSLWAFVNTGQTITNDSSTTFSGTSGSDMRAYDAWQITAGTTSVVAAVLDTGIDYTHPDLVANRWSAPTKYSVRVANKTYTCAAGTHGFNILSGTCDPMDDNGHGTHIAGIISASADTVGVLGVAPTSRVMGVKFINSSGVGTLSGAINAIEFTIQAKTALGSGANVRVLNNSYGFSSTSQALTDEINRANNNNELFVAAAGNYSTNNDTTPLYPASTNVSNVIAVAATDMDDTLASYSNFGTATVEIAAPGNRIRSTYLNHGYKMLSGTSMAAPMVVGAAILRMAVCPNENTADLVANIAKTDGVHSPVGFDFDASLTGKILGSKRLNAKKLVDKAGTPAPCLH